MRFLALLLGVYSFAQGPGMGSCGSWRSADLYRAESNGCVVVGIETQTNFVARAPEPVSLYRLKHRIPKLARREFDAARKLIGKKAYLEAEARLVAAVAADPEFADALAQLGVLQLMRGEYTGADGHLSRSARLDEANSLILGYASVARLFGGKPGEAAGLARKTLKLDPDNLQARKVLDRLTSPGKGAGYN
jgi:tetratricopeptide (TPR) repeat protein